MSIGGFSLVGTLCLMLATLAVLHYVKQRNLVRLGIELLCIGSYLILLFHFLHLPEAGLTKGTADDQRFWAAIVALLVCIVAGMFAESLYSWLDKIPGKCPRKLDWAGMIKPLFVSPLILIPMVAAFQNANIDLSRLGFPWLMILLTAFEKGFLWRYYLAHRAADLTRTGS